MALAVIIMVALSPMAALGLDLTVVDGDGVPLGTGYRWLVQLDTTYPVVPDVQDTQTLSVRLHTSHAPVLTTGHSDAATTTIAVPDTERYYVSVLPDSGHQLGGAPVAVGQAAATVVVHAHPIPLAQASVFVFEDNHQTNAAPDLPEERPLEGFKIIVIDAAGKYGAPGGQLMMDGLGNPVGTQYDAMGNPVMMGDGVAWSDANGQALIQNLAPGKYGLQVIPPAGEGWQQTSTIEGGKTVDVWIKANEPPFFVEFGPPGYHAFFGFVKETNLLPAEGGRNVTGQITNLHNSRPPDFTFWSGHPFPEPWVALSPPAGTGQTLYIAQCDEDSNFSIPHVPPGTYQLTVFDSNLDIVIANLGFTVTADPGDMDLGQVPVFAWFGRMENYVFLDNDKDGFPDPGEPGIPEQNINIRFRDGTIYNAMPTDLMGTAPFDEVFPFFNYLIYEVDYARFKATGATRVIDAGGEVLPDQGWTYPSGDVMTPMPQYDTSEGAPWDPILGFISPLINPHTGDADNPPGGNFPGPEDVDHNGDGILDPPNNLSVTEVGPVLTYAAQVFLGQTNRIWWGKAPYQPGENGGISGLALYAVTRAENDPRYAAAEEWEPGIPRVQINLYRDMDDNREIDNINGEDGIQLADVDNHPLGWADGGVMGPEDVDRNGNGVFEQGDALQVTWTDSFDDSPPVGAMGPPFYPYGDPTAATDVFDGLRNYNQVLPGVFDGGYAFNDIPDGVYIVEACAPPGYEHVKEEDRNVDFGDEFVQQAATLQLPPPAVGDLRMVPAELSLFPGTEAPFAGQMRHLPDRKHVRLGDGQNAACDFFLFTNVPIAAHCTGFVLDDTTNEFDPNSPTFGEKYSPPFLPVSVQDWRGVEVNRVYTDRWGAYNALMPSTWSANLPFASGMSPNMLTVVINHPGPVPNPDYNPADPTSLEFITDPQFDRRYSQFSYTFQYMPGSTTYLDTPVIPIAAFTGPSQFQVDMEFPNGTPVIWWVSGPGQGGPFVNTAGETLTIVSAGMYDVPNPLYDALDDTSAQPKTVERDFGFGNEPGEVSIGGVPLTGVVWTDGVINGTVTTGTKTGQLKVTRANGKSTIVGLTVTVGKRQNQKIIRVNPNPTQSSTPIQDAIDFADPGDLVLVPPGIYRENVIMWKPIQLQGWGAYSTIINAVSAPAEKVQAWRDKIRDLVMLGEVDLLAGQEIAFDTGQIEPATLAREDGAALLVLARNTGPESGGFGQVWQPRVDGLTFTGSANGGGVVLNAYAHRLTISNDRIVGNQGVLGGGIRLGHPDVTVETGAGFAYENAQNDHVLMCYNQVIGNGGLGGVGGGVSLYAGSDHYKVTDSWIAGNFTAGQGGGVGHLGSIEGGLIARNKIIFNQNFNQGLSVNGGGMFIGGNAPLVVGTPSPGAGSVEIIANLVQGNQSGAGDGSGLRIENLNGLDVQNATTQPATWNHAEILNNIFGNNVAGLAGCISLQDAVKVTIAHNTIVANDSTASAGEAFAPGSPNESTPQPAGIVSRAHSLLLTALLADAEVPAPFQGQTYSDPDLFDNIVWQNRAFYFQVDNTTVPATFGLMPDPENAQYWDLGVLGTPAAETLNPVNCILTDVAENAGYFVAMANHPVTTDAALVESIYFNGDRGQTIQQPEVKTALQVQPAFDEGGNFIAVRYGPLTLVNPYTGLLYGDYHILAGSVAEDAANMVLAAAVAPLGRDFDSEFRPYNTVSDIGADECWPEGVDGVNSTPEAAFDQFSVRQGNALTINAPGVLANDSDPDGDQLTAVFDSVEGTNEVQLLSDGSFVTTPTGAADYSFWYYASDGSKQSAPTQVLINVKTGKGNQANNQAPVAFNDPGYTVVTGEILVVAAPGVLGNDTDAEFDTFFAVQSGQPSNGTAALAADGAFVYTPNPGFTGVDSFRYRAYDGKFSGYADVDITVEPRVSSADNVAPIPTAVPIITPMNMPGITRILPNDPNFGDTHTYDVTTNPSNGKATVTPTGIVNYTPAKDYLGVDSLVVTVTDAGGLSAPVTVDVMVVEMTMIMPDAGVLVQVPPDTDGVDTNGDGDPDNDHRHLLLGAGDGFSRMADGTVLYGFGFRDLSHLLPTPSSSTVATTIPLSLVMMEGMLGAEYPAPTITMREGDRVYLNLVNVGMAIRPDLFDPHTVHFHGYSNAADVFDGVPDASIAINMGGCLTYFYVAPEDPVSAGSIELTGGPGTYMYHCHVEATEHMQMGMLGNLYVWPRQDGTPIEYPTGSGNIYTKFAYNDGDGSTGYDVDFPIQIWSFDSAFHTASFEVQPLPFANMKDDYAMLNGRGYPDTLVPGSLPALAETGGKESQRVSSNITAQQGQRVLLRVSNLNVTRFYTLQSPGIPMLVVGRDAKQLRNSETGENLYYKTNSVTLGGGQAYDIILETENVAPGTYLLHTTNLNYLSNGPEDFGGMMTEITITP